MADLAKQIGAREYSKFVPVGNSPNVSPIAVVNPDGSNISGGGGGSNATVTLVSTPTLFAVVNTTATGQASVVLDTGVKFIGLATVVIGSQPIQIIGNATGGLADTGNPVKIGGKYNSSTPIYSDGQRTDLQSDANGNIKVTLNTLIAGEDLTNNLLMVAGNIPHGSADVGNPVKIGGIAIPQTAIVSTASGNRVNAWFDNQGRLSVFWQSGATIAITSNVTLNASNAYIGLASVNIGGTLPALTTGAAYVGLASVNIGGTLPALTAGSAFIGLATIVLDRKPILGAGDTNALFASTATGSMLNVAIMGRTGNVATIDVSGNQSVINAAGSNYMGLASVNIGGTLPALVAGTAYIGLASVNIGGTLPALPASSAFIGLVSTASINGNVQLQTGTAFVGLATVIPAYAPLTSNYTSLATLISAAGNATLFVPPNNQRWVLKDLIIAASGKQEVAIISGTNTVIPYISLATQGGFVLNNGDGGWRGKAQNDAFVVNLNVANVTVSVSANVRFEA